VCNRVECIVRGKKDSERDKNRKVGERNKTKICCTGGSTHEPNQEGSEGRPSSHKYLQKGPR
jgi:hypothetical protein